MKSKQQQIENYQRGAAECRDLQKSANQAGLYHVADLHGQAMDANLDRVNELKKQGNA